MAISMWRIQCLQCTLRYEKWKSTKANRLSLSKLLIAEDCQFFTLQWESQPYGWPGLAKEMKQMSEKMSWLAVEGSCKWAHPVNTAFLKPYVCFTGGRITGSGGEYTLWKFWKKNQSINLFSTQKLHHSKWLLFAPFPKGASVILFYSKGHSVLGWYLQF